MAVSLHPARRANQLPLLPRRLLWLQEAALKRNPKRLDKEVGVRSAQPKTAAWEHPHILVSLCRVNSVFSWSGPILRLQYLWPGSVLASPEGEISLLGTPLALKCRKSRKLPHVWGQRSSPQERGEAERPGLSTPPIPSTAGCGEWGRFCRQHPPLPPLLHPPPRHVNTRTFSRALERGSSGFGA